jgi:hypothetical protein
MSTSTYATDQTIEARDRIAVAGGIALLVAGLILVAAVLPAEYGVDPLGTGRWLGLMAMSDARRSVDEFVASRENGAPTGSPVLAAQDQEFKRETVDFKIAPRDSFEYKYRLEKGEALLYSWKASERLNYELHAEPDGAPRGYAESFEKVNGKASASGTLTAPFTGIHGWYWENTSDHEVTLTLSSAGFYNMSHEFRKGAPPKAKMFQ